MTIDGRGASGSFLRCHGVELYYESHGQGPPLLLVAGLASDSQSWLPVVDGLAQHHTVVALDNRCCGRTTPHDCETSIQLMADDCIALLDHLGLAAADMLGHSMGGMVALDCAIRYPQCVSRLVLAATSARISERNSSLFRDRAAMKENGMPDELWFRNLFYWLFRPGFFDDHETVKAAVQAAVEYPYPQSPVEFRNQVEALATFNCVESLADIQVDTLVINGSCDLLFPPGECVNTLRTIPRVSFVTLDAAHALHVEQPREFVRAVCAFLGG